MTSFICNLFRRQPNPQQDRIERLLGALSSKLDILIGLEVQMSKELDDLTTEVSETKTIVASAVTLINGINDRITAAGVDPAKLAALTSDLDASSKALADAVAANTPADPNA
jgi:hypothetical protein